MRYNGAASASQLPAPVPLTISDGSGTDTPGPAAPFMPAAIAPMLPPPTLPRGDPMDWGGSINSVAVHPQSTPTSGTAAQPFGDAGAGFLYEPAAGPGFLRHVSMHDGCGFPIVSVAVLALAGYALGKAVQTNPPALGAYAGALLGYLYRPLD